MNIEHQNGKTDHLKRAKQAVGSILAVAALGGGIAIGDKIHDAYQDRKDVKVWQHDKTAAVEIAKRFTDCHVESFTDLHAEPTAESDLRKVSPKGRTVVKLELSLKETEAAQASKAPYEDNDRVLWYKPVMYGAIQRDPQALETPELEDLISPNVAPDTYLANDELTQMTQRGDFTGTLKAEFYPKTNYPDGKQARIVVTQAVSATDGSGRRFLAEGYTDCGTMIFNGKTRTWELQKASSSEEPVVKKYEDDDGDDMWEPTATK